MGKLLPARVEREDRDPAANVQCVFENLSVRRSDGSSLASRPAEILESGVAATTRGRLRTLDHQIIGFLYRHSWRSAKGAPGGTLPPRTVVNFSQVGLFKGPCRSNFSMAMIGGRANLFPLARGLLQPAIVSEAGAQLFFGATIHQRSG
jgi:hypothetical protein